MATADVVVAGHCCLDVIPSFPPRSDGLLRPGMLVNVGPAVLAPGGAVSNVGLALSRLGTAVRLLGKVGDDQFGTALLDLYRAHDASIAEGMIVAAGEPTSYSIVISPPGSDRIFLHCPGANDTFAAEDVAAASLEGARIFHFGYPPIMRRMYADGGEELTTILQRAKDAGLLTALDMALPDPDSDAGRADWRAILRRALPAVDLFLPSIEEILYMLDRERHEALRAKHGAEHYVEGIDGALLGRVADQLLEWGASVIGLKLGDQGLYLRSGDDGGLHRLARSATGRGGTPHAPHGNPSGADRLPTKANSEKWANRELLAPCYAVRVAGTTGSGDTTIAGFLTGLLHDMTPESTLRSAVAVGAWSVEQVDATSGVPTWEAVQARIAGGWQRASLSVALPGWHWDEVAGVWYGPADAYFGG